MHAIDDRLLSGNTIERYILRYSNVTSDSWINYNFNEQIFNHVDLLGLE